jgi:hypothetical protein
MIEDFPFSGINNPYLELILKIEKFTFFVVKNYVFYNKKSGFLIFRTDIYGTSEK